MPLYEYQCSKCQEVHEIMQKFSDAPLTACPTCGSPVSKLMSLSSFALKGSGWYTTDYKRASSNPPTSTKPNSPEPSSPAADGGSTNKETKPAPVQSAPEKADVPKKT